MLTGLKRYPELQLFAIPSGADNGGSTGILRDELGVLPPGDFLQCLCALATDERLRQVIAFRFATGTFEGHTVGNVLLAALEKVCGDPLLAASEAHRIFQVQGRVIPVSACASNLYAELEDGTVIEGEHAIDQPTGERKPIKQCFLSPPSQATTEAITTLRRAHAILFGPGDLFTSSIPPLLVDGVGDAIAECRGHRILTVNLMTKRGETEYYTAQRFCDVINQYIAPAKINAVIVNNAPLPEAILAEYAKAGDQPVQDDLGDSAPFLVHRAPLISGRPTAPVRGDRVRRSLLRHDPHLLATAVLAVLQALSARDNQPLTTVSPS